MYGVYEIYTYISTQIASDYYYYYYCFLSRCLHKFIALSECEQQKSIASGSSISRSLSYCFSFFFFFLLLFSFIQFRLYGEVVILFAFLVYHLALTKNVCVCVCFSEYKSLSFWNTIVRSLYLISYTSPSEFNIFFFFFLFSSCSCIQKKNCLLFKNHNFFFLYFVYYWTKSIL